MSLRCLRATESVRGTKIWALGMTNRGSLSDTGYKLFIASRAAIGHKGECPNKGIEIVTISFLFLDGF